MIKTSKTAISLLIILLLFSTAARAATDPDIAAVSALLVETESGTVLYEKNKDERRPPDSLAKLFTVYIAADMCQRGLIDKDTPVTMSQSAWLGITSKNTTLDIKPGEQMTLIDLMYSAYLGSAVEACNMIAELISGSVSDFVGLMNEYARNLDCSDTYFTNTHGQYDPGQYTTAWDQYLIYREALKNPLFCEISGTYRYYTEPIDNSAARRLVSPNHMLNPDSRYYYRYCTGGRPSATFEGGYSLAASAERDGSILVSVILGSEAVILEDESTLMQNLSETKRLFEWGFSEFGWRNILSESELVAKAPVTYGDGADYVNLRPLSSLNFYLETAIDNEEFTRSVKVYSVENGERLNAPIEAGTVLGEITITRGSVSYGTVPLVANTSVGLHRVEYIRSQMKSILGSAAARTIIAVIVVLLVVYIALLMHYNKLRRERLRRIERTKERLANERRTANKD